MEEELSPGWRSVASAARARGVKVEQAEVAQDKLRILVSDWRQRTGRTQNDVASATGIAAAKISKSFPSEGKKRRSQGEWVVLKWPEVLKILEAVDADVESFVSVYGEAWPEGRLALTASRAEETIAALLRGFTERLARSEGEATESLRRQQSALEEKLNQELLHERSEHNAKLDAARSDLVDLSGRLRVSTDLAEELARNTAEKDEVIRQKAVVVARLEEKLAAAARGQRGFYGQEKVDPMRDAAVLRQRAEQAERQVLEVNHKLRREQWAAYAVGVALGLGLALVALAVVLVLQLA